jgi:thiopurine S-methyltransferase
MDLEFWTNRWNTNQIGFHRAGVNPLLKRYWPEVSKTFGKVFVPLCGKSEDLSWLALQGHGVVGVELSEIAVNAFSQEQGVPFTRTQAGPFTAYRGQMITIYAGDFFQFNDEFEGLFPLFYDRAALIALPDAMRPKYVRKLQSLVAENGSGLLITVEYDPAAMAGPPFAVAEPEVRELFKTWHCEKRFELDCLEDEPRFKARGLSWMKEVVYRLEKRVVPVATSP